MPTISSNKLNYHRTGKSVTLHLFEWTDEYMNSFSGGKLENGPTTHWGENEAKRSITRLFDQYEKKIFDWFERANSIERLIEIATRQIQEGKSYNMHSPDPQFVLAFLLAKAGQPDKAILTFEQLDDYKDNEELKTKIGRELTKNST